MSDPGWGTTSSGGPQSNVLLEVEVPVVTNDQCKTTMGSSSITDSMICAGGVAGKDSCQVRPSVNQLICGYQNYDKVEKGRKDEYE